MFSTVSGSLYGLGSCSRSESYVTENIHLSPSVIMGEAAAAAAAAASDSHKEAERRRRKRINGHIATLKSVLPNVTKTDKASLLGEAVRRVRELNKAAEEISDETQLKCFFPNESDELKVIPGEENCGLMKATLCCEDRPEIVLDIIQALKTADGKVARAEMSTMGGRTKCVLWVQLNVKCGESDVGLSRLRRALKGVMDKPMFAGSGSKRARYFYPST